MKLKNKIKMSRASAFSPQVTEAINSMAAITFWQTRGYLPSRRVSPPIGQYQIILLSD